VSHRYPASHLFAPPNPPADPDDHFDLAAAYAVNSLDLRAVVLDNLDSSQLARPGTIAVQQLNAITGRQVPAALGVARRMRSPDDRGDDDASPGPSLILDTLAKAPRPVAITIVCSARDVMIAFNRNPQLFREKVEKIVAFMGDADESSQEPAEHNVQAYVALMRSGLPIDWVPCFDGGLFRVNRGRASYWSVPQESALVSTAAPSVQQYFIYLMYRSGSSFPCPSEATISADPIAFLRAPVSPAYQTCLFALRRNLWAGAALAVAANQLVGAGGELGPSSGVFDFEPVKLSVDDRGHVAYGGPITVQRFRRQVSPEAYAQSMTQATTRLIASVGRNQRN
jgi:hypothetical protein